MSKTVGDIKLSDLGKKIRFYFREDYGIVGTLVGVEAKHTGVIKTASGIVTIVLPPDCSLTLLLDNVETTVSRVPSSTRIEFLDTPSRV